MIYHNNQFKNVGRPRTISVSNRISLWITGIVKTAILVFDTTLNQSNGKSQHLGVPNWVCQGSLVGCIRHRRDSKLAFNEMSSAHLYLFLKELDIIGFK